MPRIYLHASELACLLNKNPYDVLSGFNRIINKFYKSEIHDIQKTLDDSHQIITQKLVEIEKQPDSLKNDKEKKILVKQASTIEHKINNLETSTTTDKDKISKIIPDYKPDISQTPTVQKQELRKVITEKFPEKIVDDKLIENFINKDYGTKTEDSAIQIFEKKFNLILDKSQNWYEYKIKSTKSFDYYLGGKMDGIHKEQNFIVEVKNRMRGFFPSLKEYEKCQVYTYMILTDINQVKLVEQFQGKIKTTNISLENSYKQELFDLLDIFIKNLDLFLSSNDISKYLLMNDTEKTKFIHTLYLDEMIEYFNESDDSSKSCMFE
jgi:hypothetical protein